MKDCVNAYCSRKVPDCGCVAKDFGDLLHDQEHLTCGIICSTMAMEQRMRQNNHQCCLATLVQIPSGLPCKCTCHHFWDCKCEAHR